MIPTCRNAKSDNFLALNNVAPQCYVGTRMHSNGMRTIRFTPLPPPACPIAFMDTRHLPLPTPLHSGIHTTPCLPHCMLGYTPPPTCLPHCMPGWIYRPPMNRMTDICKTLPCPKLRLRAVKARGNTPPSFTETLDPHTLISYLPCLFSIPPS